MQTDNSHWQFLPLSEVADASPNSFVDGPFGSDLKSDEYTAEGIRLIQLQNIGDGEWNDDNKIFTSEKKYQDLKRHAAFPGDIAIAKMADPVARACIIPPVSDYFLVVADCIRLSPDLKKFSPKFIVYAINSHNVRLQAELKSTGTTRKRINLSLLKTVKVELPSLPEQSRIAEILDTIDEAIQKTEALISKLKSMKQGLLHDLLTRGLDKNGKLRDPKAHPEQFKNSPLGRIPKEWAVVRLLDHVSLPNGQVDPKQMPYCHWPLIAPDHIESVTGRLLCLETAMEQGAISGKYEFKPGDVLYSKIRPYLRKAVLADRQGLCSADMYPLQPGPSLVPRFLLDVILGEHFSRFAASVSERSGFPKINRKELGEYRLAFPSTDEQLHIASVMDTHDARIRTEEQYRDKLKLQKKGLMHDLLTGKVRVQI